MLLRPLKTANVISPIPLQVLVHQTASGPNQVHQIHIRTPIPPGKIIFLLLMSYAYFFNDSRPISEEPQDRSSATTQSPTSSHGNEWGGFEDSEMNPPSSHQNEFPQDDIGMLGYSLCCRT